MKTKHSKRFKKTVILDSVILTPEQWKTLRLLTDELEVIKGKSHSNLTNELRANIRFDPNIRYDKSKERLDDEIYCGVQMTVPKRTQDEMIEILKDVNAIVTCWTPIPNNVIYHLEHKLGHQVQTISAWTNFTLGRIDEAYMQKFGIDVRKIPDYGTEAVSQYVFAMVYYQLLRTGNISGAEKEFAEYLTNIRRVIEQIKATQSHNWRFESLKRDNIEVDPAFITERTLPTFPSFKDSVLRGKQVGIIGMGRIGTEVRKMADGLGMRVEYFSNSSQTMSLRDIFMTSDFVSLNLPPTGAQGLITPELIRQMHEGAMLLNTSVGNVILDERAMFNIAKEKNIILGLDVYQRLPPLSLIKKVRRKDENLIIATYRNGWYTREALMIKGWSLIRNLIQGMGLDNKLSRSLVGQIEKIKDSIRKGISENNGGGTHYTNATRNLQKRLENI